MEIGSWLVVTGLTIDIVAVLSFACSGHWYGTATGIAFVDMKAQVDKHGEGRGWLSAFFGFSSEDWHKTEKHKFNAMLRTHHRMRAWQWSSVVLILVGFVVQIIGNVI